MSRLTEAGALGTREAVPTVCEACGGTKSAPWRACTNCLQADGATLRALAVLGREEVRQAFAAHARLRQGRLAAIWSRFKRFTTIH